MKKQPGWRARAAGLSWPALLALVAVLAAGCDESVIIGEMRENRPPTINLVHGPHEGEDTNYRVTFYWMGEDPDGEVAFYEFIVVDGDPLGFDPADTACVWSKTERTDSTFFVSADEFDRSVGDHTHYRRMHTFFIRAVDDRGACSETAYRSFNAWTLAPYAVITEPDLGSINNTVVLGPKIIFEWETYDPIATGYDTQPADSIRYMYTEFYGEIMKHLNAEPERFDTLWSPWVAVDAPGDSGMSTVLGDDEMLRIGHIYIFVVQAMDEAGAITSVFEELRNVARFIVVEPTGPLITISEYYLGQFLFIGTKNAPKSIKSPAGLGMRFSWIGDASHYGAEIGGYRYGWDVRDINDDDAWATPLSPYVRSTPETTFHSGIHCLYIEGRDHLGVKTLCRIEVTIFPLSMDRNLLWVDDFYSRDFTPGDYAFPNETQHDEFWLGICSRAEGFNPDIDFWDTNRGGTENFQPPDLEFFWRYKNVVWTATDPANFTAWHRLIHFVPNTAADEDNLRVFNFLAYYIRAGGHLWTVTKGNQGGGLTGVFAWILYRTPLFPFNVKCEITENSTGCTDTLGTETIAYEDYCVTVLDKSKAQFKELPGMPTRRLDWDSMAFAYIDRYDQYNAAFGALPDTILLWEECSKPGRFFDPAVRGFYYQEVYNPKYWMNYHGLTPQPCFHPMYRMRARSALSCLNAQTVAFWVTKYDNVIANAPGAVAAPSAHFGIPLWFFDRKAVRQVADVIFDAWGILDSN